MIESKDLQNRGPQADTAPRANRVETTKPVDAAAEELATLKARIEKIDALTLVEAQRLGQNLHCGHCWGEGRRAALIVLRGEVDV